jgi:hypothetical protein
MQGEDSRVFKCKRCGQEARICRRCDRGNVYCGKACRKEARLETWRRSGAKSRKKERTRILHKMAQQRYLENRGKKMTQQGSHSDEVAADCGQDKEHESKPHEERFKRQQARANPQAAREPAHSGEPLKRPQAMAMPKQPKAVHCDFCGRMCLPGNRRIKLLAVARRERRSARHQYG